MCNIARSSGLPLFNVIDSCRSQIRLARALQRQRLDDAVINNIVSDVFNNGTQSRGDTPQREEVPPEVRSPGASHSALPGGFPPRM